MGRWSQKLVTGKTLSGFYSGACRIVFMILGLIGLRFGHNRPSLTVPNRAKSAELKTHLPKWGAFVTFKPSCLSTFIVHPHLDRTGWKKYLRYNGCNISWISSPKPFGRVWGEPGEIPCQNYCILGCFRFGSLRFAREKNSS